MPAPDSTHELDAGGAGVSFGWPSPTDDAGIAEDSFCQPSFLDRISEALGRQ
jgi:hypothetical protein